MVAGAEFDPLVVEADLNDLKIREIFERRRESAKLDYKRHVDPSIRRDSLELIKDVVAMANTAGGYVVVGVADDGTGVGLTDEQVGRLDEAVLRAQIGAYLGTGIEIFVNRINRDQRTFVIITVLRSGQSPIVFEKDGQYGIDGGRSVSVFRQGDVFVRHGSASERWDQEDVRTVYSRIVHREKEKWLAEVLPDVRRLIELAGGGKSVAPSASELLLADAETFERTLRGK